MKGATIIVGIGASAGGLEAVEQFLEQVPAMSGMAFIVVQHLDPAQKGMMPALLQKVSLMPVVEVENDMQVEANHVYVIPPTKDMTILHGKLHLLEPVPVRGMWQPIDYFFHALAEDCREHAVGVVLSGMGTDGTLGLRAIKEKHGLALVQEPDTAKFEGMPKSAMTTVVVDIVGPPDELPGKLIEYLREQPPQTASDELPDMKSHHALEKIVVLIRERTGNDLSLYKKRSLYRRIERRMGLHCIDSIDSYVRYLRENPQELDLLFKDLLIGVTAFFRDRDVWDYLADFIFPALFERYPLGREFRAWVPSCSTGEEAYSLAMLFHETLDRLRPGVPYRLQIFATDLDPDSIEKAREGRYPASIATEVSPERLAQFFTPDGAGFRIRKEIREQIIFAAQNLIMDPPFTRLDLLSCRNLLIYLGPELQQQMFRLFHYALDTDGILLLGNAETVEAHSELFAPLSHRWRVYRRLHLAPEQQMPGRVFPMTVAAEDKRNGAIPPGSLQSLADHYLLQHFTPAAVLVNADGDILYISGRTGKYLEPAAGKANWNIHAMAREELRHELALALRKALRQGETVRVNGLSLRENGWSETVNLTVQPIMRPVGLKGLLAIAFTPAASAARAEMERRIGQRPLADELHSTQDELQELREAMRLAQDEFKVRYDELRAVNLEQQSIIEELSSSKEEMQSINEEQNTINMELQAKINDLAWIGSDLDNLVIGAGIIALTLDNQLRIRRYTPAATRLFKLIPSDTGRPLSDITSCLDYPSLQQDTQEVLRTLVPSEKQISAEHQAWFRVRIVPYRMQNGVVDGVLLSFLDITEFRSRQQRSRPHATRRKG